MRKSESVLLEARKRLHLTQQQLAELLGVSKNYIYLIESGRKPLTESILRDVEKLDNKPIRSNLTREAGTTDWLPMIEARLDAIETDLALVKRLLSAGGGPGGSASG